eukprot:CAMPEP_0172170338 /NCGR_PEP_ID=MMETSP1050-20130122/11207_1 /TAXON_ID=233186 /ORGANISM="Cryptomonas curvata, Strain CCAP979/52" /LENGTH=73 /DNA_ID=CAMNT_0012841499 /DNA_START=99 /DNA_END=321 /DNA_ORIENTATION=-
MSGPAAALPADRSAGDVMAELAELHMGEERAQSPLAKVASSFFSASAPFKASAAWSWCAFISALSAIAFSASA